MARRPSCVARFLPICFEPVQLFERHQDGIERAGSETRLLAKGITMMPIRGMLKERFQEREGLRGDADSTSHASNKST